MKFRKLYAATICVAMAVCCTMSTFVAASAAVVSGAEKKVIKESGVSGTIMEIDDG